MGCRTIQGKPMAQYNSHYVCGGSYRVSSGVSSPMGLFRTWASADENKNKKGFCWAYFGANPFRENDTQGRGPSHREAAHLGGKLWQKRAWVEKNGAWVGALKE